MVIRPEAAVTATIENTMEIRQMVPADIRAGLRLCRAAGWNQLEADWRWFLELNPGGCRVAVVEGKVVGTVTTLRFGQRFGWVSMLLVDPAMRNRGIGSHLFRESLAVLEDVETIRLDATPAGKAVYDRFGFADEYLLARTRALDPSPVAPSGPPPRPIAAADLPGIAEFDRPVFGADRGELLRRIWESAPEYGLVLESGGAVEGYILGRHGFRAEHLGPVVAADEAGAARLVAACLQTRRGKPFSLDAPQHSQPWLEWLRSAGFAAERPFIRMYRGPHRCPGLPSRQFAIAGPELG
jgi:predicted N-acetyltransferase YhbS